MSKFSLAITETFLTMKAVRYWRSLLARNITVFKVAFAHLMNDMAEFSDMVEFSDCKDLF